MDTSTRSGKTMSRPGLTNPVENSEEDKHAVLRLWKLPPVQLKVFSAQLLDAKPSNTTDVSVLDVVSLLKNSRFFFLFLFSSFYSILLEFLKEVVCMLFSSWLRKIFVMDINEWKHLKVMETKLWDWLTWIFFLFFVSVFVSLSTLPFNFLNQVVYMWKKSRFKE